MPDLIATVKVGDLPVVNKTLEGDNLIIDQSDSTRRGTVGKVIKDMGLMRMFTFLEGGVLTSVKDQIYDAATKKVYRWNGDYPKTIPANSSIDSTGGISPSAWLAATEDKELAGKLSSTTAGTPGSKLIGVVDPIGGGKTLDDMLTSRVAPGLILDHATTSWAGIDAKDMTTDNTARFSELLNSKKYVTVDSTVNLSRPVVLSIPEQIIQGTPSSVIRPIDPYMAYSPMIKAYANGTHFIGLRFTNPNMYKGHESFNSSRPQRQGAIDIGGDFCIVDRCIFRNQLNAVIANITRAAHGTKVINNFFLDCLGTGSGPDPDNPYPNSNAGEDRGDAVTLWGSGSLIAHNYANAMAGQDCRVAFHFESTGGGGIANPRPFDESNNIMIGNVAYGSFRRHFVMENIHNGMSIGNTSIGGATWWCEAIIQCKNVVFENTLYYDRTSDLLYGQSWNPNRGASALVNYNENVKVRSRAFLMDGSVGSGFVINKRTAKMDYTCEMEMVNKGSESNTAIYLVGSSEKGVFNGVKAEGFGRQVGFYSDPNVQSNMVFNHCEMNGNGTNTAFSNTGGDQTARIAISGGTWTGNSQSFLSLSQVSELHVAGATIDAETYAMNVFTITKALSLQNCKTVQGKTLSIRVGGTTAGALPYNIPWDFSGNMGISHNFSVSQTNLSSATSSVNTVGKYAGKLVMVSYGTTREMLMATGSAATDTWVNVSKKTALADITPA